MLTYWFTIQLSLEMQGQHSTPQFIGGPLTNIIDVAVWIQR